MELEGRDVPAVIFDGTFPLEGSGGKAEVTVQVSYDASVDPYYHWDYYVTNQSVGPNELQPYIDSDAMTMFWVVTGLEWDSKAPAVTNQSQPSGWNGHTWDYLGDTGAFWSTYPNYLPFNTPAKFSFTTAPTTITICDATFGDDAFGEAVGKVAGPGVEGDTVVYFVNTNDDTSDANLGDGKPLDKNGNTSLRAALEEGNAGKANNIWVQLAPESQPGGGVITLASELPALDKNFSVVGFGPGANIVERDAKAANFRIFTISAGSECAISNIGIRNGEIQVGNGAGILNRGELTLARCSIYKNFTSGDGGGVASEGILRVYNTSVFDNECEGRGGGLYITTFSEGDRLDVFGNKADSPGGGIYISESGEGSFTRSYFFANTTKAGNGGGVAVNGGKFTLIEGEIHSNVATLGSGGGIWIEGTLTSEVAIIDVNIESNTSKSGGGGVYLGSKGELYMEGVQIRQNETAGNGGGLLQVDGVLTAQSIACTDNKAGVDGGGFHLEGKVQNLALVSLSGNTALGSYNGGFITKNADVQQYTPPAGGKVTIFADGSIEFTNT